MNDLDPRVKRTRKLLQDAFMALMAEKGFQATSVQDIAERATLNRATFYAHFEDKFALADYMLTEQFHEALDPRLTTRSPFTLNNLHLLAATVCEFVGHFIGHCAPQDIGMDPRIEAKVQQELETFLRGWLANAPHIAAAPRASSAATASVMSWAIFGSSLEWSRSERAIPADEWARQVVTVLLGGVAPLVESASQTPPSGANSSTPNAPLPTHR